MKNSFTIKIIPIVFALTIVFFSTELLASGSFVNALQADTGGNFLFDSILALLFVSAIVLAAKTIYENKEAPEFGGNI
ncbi:MAG TPA: hypothetical protein DCQ31_08355 [Bacteroidales bacterium]|nr:hypothetical protein [Bacteroidales bacterium]